MRINVEDFFEEHHLRFESKKQGVAWVKRNLKPISLLRVGPCYLVDEKEITKLFKEYISNQEILSYKRSERIKALNKKKKRSKPSSTET